MDCILNCNNLKNIKLATLLDPSCDCVEPPIPLIQFVKATKEMYVQPGLLLEERLIKKAVKKRQQEFRAGRHAARAAIKKLMSHDAFAERQPILIGASREPIFPSAISGSISHTDSLCFAACALKSQVASIGIDIENNQPIEPRLFPVVYTQSEQIRLMETDNLPTILIFSIKESLFKCLFPFVKVYFDFLDAEIHLQAETENRGQFQIELIGNNHSDLQSALPNLEFHGHYWFSEQHVFSLCFYRS